MKLLLTTITLFWVCLDSTAGSLCYSDYAAVAGTYYADYDASMDSCGDTVMCTYEAGLFLEQGLNDAMNSFDNCCENNPC